MVIIKFHFLLLITIFHVSNCERRIVEGEQVTSEKSYVVYLVKGTISDRTYDSWLCGGALVSKEFIITSAACVEDVHYMYAIAGYRKYVNDKNLEKDDCTKQMKKKIVYTCVPLSYEFDFDKIEKWAYIDIALVKVESPYDFDDARFQLICSYIPSIIPINYDLKRQATNVDAMVLGWGHTEYWRQRGDIENYNQDYLRFASTTLFDKNKCQQEYQDYVDLKNIIEKYMICSMEPGHLNDHGVPNSMNQMRGRDGCITQKQKSMGMHGILCQVELTPDQPEQVLMNHLVHEDETRKRMSLNEKINNTTDIKVNGTGFVKGTDNDNGTNIVKGTDIANGTDIVNGTDSIDRTDFIYKPGFGNISGYFNRTFTRRNGICQNDHGGPLVTWVGKREVLIGVASVFKITEQNKCVGPFLYTSTMCNGAFLGCVLGDRRANMLRGKDTSVSTSKALFCDSPPSVKGFDTIESYVSWKDHPDGPADNEKHLRGRLEPNLKKDHYATNLKEDSEEDVNPLNDITKHKIIPNIRPKKDKQETNDRFSLRIGLPPGIRPPPRNRPPLRKIPPLKQESPPIVESPQETEHPPINSPPPELAPPRPPSEMEPPPIIWPPHTIEPSPIISLPPQMEPPAFDEILNFKSDEVIVEKKFESKPSQKAIQPSSVVQPEIQIRPQSPLRVSTCERRIQDGINTKAEKPYVVYLVKAPVSKSGYDYWLCGGALVTSDFVVTSAACIKDVNYLYVIAGYNKYVTDKDIELDPCTSKMKKKVIYTCYPQGYELNYEQLDVWSLIDIGVAKVESPYDFNDQTYKQICSYIPGIIPISYDAKYQAPGSDAVVFGWGHKFEWRKQEDTANHNQQYLNYAPVMIMEKQECKSHYEEYGNMRRVIDTYMICTLESGHFDDFGERLEEPGGQAQIPPSLLNGCAKRKSSAFNPDEAIENCEDDYQYDDTRRKIKRSNHSSNNSMFEITNKNNGNKTRAEPNRTAVSNRTGLTNRSALTNRPASTKRIAPINRPSSFEELFVSNKTVVFNETVRDTRKYGICQNDHGGPLVAWVGAHETLIGVASVFKVSENFKCTGPYLYTSTQCNSAFLDCILTKANFDFRRSLDTGIVFNSSRRSFCRKSINDERHPMVERHISWLYHPAGAADYERHLKHGRNGPDVNERAPGMNEEILNKSERSVNLADKMNPQNKRLNEKFVVNFNNAPNERYTSNNKHVPNVNNAPNINENGTPNNKYVADDKYRPYNIPEPYSRPASYNGLARNNWPALNYNTDQINYQTSNNKPALNHEIAQKYWPAQNEGPAQNNEPIQNNEPAQNNRPVQNNRPESNNK